MQERSNVALWIEVNNRRLPKVCYTSEQITSTIVEEIMLFIDKSRGAGSLEWILSVGSIRSQLKKIVRARCICLVMCKGFLGKGIVGSPPCRFQSFQWLLQRTWKAHRRVLKRELMVHDLGLDVVDPLRTGSHVRIVARLRSNGHKSIVS